MIFHSTTEISELESKVVPHIFFSLSLFREKAQGGAKQKKKGSNGTGGISATSIDFYINRYLYITANERFFFLEVVAVAVAHCLQKIKRSGQRWRL